jgi:hypothetical protein
MNLISLNHDVLSELTRYLDHLSLYNLSNSCTLLHGAIWNENFLKKWMMNVVCNVLSKNYQRRFKRYCRIFLFIKRRIPFENFIVFGSKSLQHLQNIFKDDQALILISRQCKLYILNNSIDQLFSLDNSIMSGRSFAKSGTVQKKIDAQLRHYSR